MLRSIATYSNLSHCFDGLFVCVFVCLFVCLFRQCTTFNTLVYMTGNDFVSIIFIRVNHIHTYDLNHSCVAPSLLSSVRHTGAY